MNNRKYYHDINGKMEPDHENMAAYLIDEGVLVLTSVINRDTQKECLELSIMINDYFGPGSDAESVTYDELPKIYDMYINQKYDGVCQFVADKRGVSNIHWRNT